MGNVELGVGSTAHQVQDIGNVLSQTSPEGQAPLVARLADVEQLIAMSHSTLIPDRKCVVVVIATSSIPSDGDQRAFRSALRRLMVDVPVRIVIRLGCDDKLVVNFYTEIARAFTPFSF